MKTINRRLKVIIMKKLVLIVVAVMLLAIGAGVALAGNGAPSGAHYNLNIIGVSSDKSADMTGSNGHGIFVPLAGKTAIQLTEGDFKVLDANGTDGKAIFQLPNPDPENDGITTYSVYARALGKPGGSSTTTPYIIDADGNYWYSTGSVTLKRDKGKSTFQNVSKELLYVYVDIDGDGTIDRIPLFSNDAYQYFWEYDNKGLKLAQLRFYEIPTDVN
jgi:hypothetical protein